MSNTKFELLPYAYMREMAQAYEASGRVVFICKDRNGSTKLSLNGGPRKTVHDAMKIIEDWYSKRT